MTHRLIGVISHFCRPLAGRGHRTSAVPGTTGLRRIAPPDWECTTCANTLTDHQCIPTFKLHCKGPITMAPHPDHQRGRLCPGTPGAGHQQGRRYRSDPRPQAPRPRGPGNVRILGRPEPRFLKLADVLNKDLTPIGQRKRYAAIRRIPDPRLQTDDRRSGPGRDRDRTDPGSTAADPRVTLWLLDTKATARRHATLSELAWHRR